MRGKFEVDETSAPEGSFSGHGSATPMRGKSEVDETSAPEGSFSSHGSATPMRGKSPTCRKARFQEVAVSDRKRKVGDPKKKVRTADGKSETCRASEWQSQVRRSLLGKIGPFPNHRLSAASSGK